MAACLDPWFQLPRHHVEDGGRSVVAAMPQHQASVVSLEKTELIHDRVTRRARQRQPYLVPRKEHLTAQVIADRLRRVESLAEAEGIHAHISDIGLDKDAFLSNLLISIYRKYGCLEKARSVFDNLTYPPVVSWNNIITAYVKHGRCTEALHLFQQMLQQGYRPNRVTFISILSACISSDTLAEGKWIHAHAVKEGLKADIQFNNALITMYNKCGDLQEAISVFQHMKDRSLVSWNAMISAYCKHGQGDKALDMFARMQQQHVNPDGYTFTNLVGAFTSPSWLEKAKEVHEYVIDHGFHKDIIVANALIAMYNRCGNAEMAFSVFEQMPEHDLISWTVMIDAYAQNGYGGKALEMFHLMLEQDHNPNAFTFQGALAACASLKDLNEAKSVHRMAKQLGLMNATSLANSLIYTYGKCGAMDDARAIFNGMTTRDVITWTIMLHAYASNDYAEETLKLFGEINQDGIKPDKAHLVSVLDACGNLSALEAGKSVHAYSSDNGFFPDIDLSNALISMYGKCGTMKEACSVFQRMRKRDLVSWNAMISVYKANGRFKEALDCLSEMIRQGVQPDKISFMGVLGGCVEPESLKEGKLLHLNIVEHGLERECELACSLITMYGKCRSIEDAQAVFNDAESQDAVLWNAMISAHNNYGNGYEAIEVYQQMQSYCPEPANVVTFISVLEACSIAPVPGTCKQIHASVREAGMESNEFIAVGLINMYSKLKAVGEAKQVFDKLQTPNVVAWTTMIDAYSRCGCSKEAMQLYNVMELNGLQANAITFGCLLYSCDNPSAIELGKILHTLTVLRGFDLDLVMGNSLMSMYGKCGTIQDVRNIFDSMRQRDVISWGTMIDLSVKFGLEEEALHLYDDMQHQKVKPNQVTFLKLLQVCTRLKHLEKGRNIHADVEKAGLLSCDLLAKAIAAMYRSCSALSELSKS